MGTNGRNRWSGRGFVSVLAGGSFAVLAATGAFLFAMPPGRVANWTGWRLLGLSKDQWQALHVSFAALFVITAAVHIWFNWRVLLCYFKESARGRWMVRWDWVAALAICVAFGAGAIASLPPFAQLMETMEGIKHGWDTREERPPVPHAELLTLAEVASAAQVDIETLEANLAAHGIAIPDATTTVGELAFAHGLTPQQLYAVASGAAEPPGEGGGPARGRGQGGAGAPWGGGAGRRGGDGPGGAAGSGGFGRMTLEAYAAGRGLDISEVLARLKAAGYEARPGETFREIGDRAGVFPHVIREILEGSAEAE
ncbi:MAG: DUF4405 domain-containing protein [Planctomycetes bacterium]|nr:DUF4405 domain-containing protein [Planctomycetota bacterium]